MEIATAMSHLVLDMRSKGRNTPANRKKLERLAVQFLQAVEQENSTLTLERQEKPGYTM